MTLIGSRLGLCVYAETSGADKLAHTQQVQQRCPKSHCLRLKEILQGRDIVSVTYASAKVVRFREHFVANYGVSVALIELRSLSFVANNGNVPTPKVYSTQVEWSTNSILGGLVFRSNILD